jgi:hypothetical protein
MTQRLYCYVDETGLDTEGELFIVGVVVSEEERDDLIRILELIERDSGKGKAKWNKASYGKRIAYMSQVLHLSLFRGKLCFCVHRDHRESYLLLTVQGIAKAFRAQNVPNSTVLVFIDGLPDSQIRTATQLLRDEGVPVNKVRGIKKDEHNALIRLADALCGLVRAAIEEQPQMLQLFERGMRMGSLIDVFDK